ncbi:MAG TPA: putative 2-aminoethylphosphonate ABC transporter permease subunit, partial [Anaerolineae bacterium]|nr:putative 2-aminoethylphosphonate ABC transporter permease subunit [Anaerolineae bacterium]
MSAATTPITPAEARRLRRQVVRQKTGAEDFLRMALFFLIAAWLVVFMIWPLYRALVRSLYDKSGEHFVGLANYITYFSTPSAVVSLLHSLNIAFVSMVITVGLAFVYAYALTRTTIPGKKVLNTLAR